MWLASIKRWSEVRVKCMDDLAAFIKSRGKRIELANNEQLPLTEKGMVWFLESGSLNLFAIQLKDSIAEGPLRLISHFKHPCLLFEMAFDASHQIIAAAEKQCVLWKIAAQEIPADLISKSSLLKQWINQLALFFKNEARTEADEYCLIPETISLKSGQTLMHKRVASLAEKKEINWMKVERGSLEFLGYPSLVLQAGTLLPMTYNTWVMAKEESSIEIVEGVEDWKKGLHSFHQMLLAYLLQRLSKEEEEERLRIKKRSELEIENVSRSLKEMISVINPIETFHTAGSSDPLFRACEILGNFVGIAFKMPALLPESGDLSQIVAAICDASGVRHRQASFEANWWKKDCGPLLAFYGPDLKPVALIAKNAGHYEMIDAHGRLKVDARIASELSPIAFCFYPPFPDELKTGKEVVRFYLKHNLKEFKPLLIYSVLAALMALFTPFATEMLFNKIIPETNMPVFWQISAAIFLAALSSGFFLFLRSLVMVRIEGQSSNQIQLGFWDRLLKLPVSFFRRFSTGNLILRVLSTEEIRTLLSGNAARVMLSGVFSIFYLIAMFIYAPSLAFIGMGITLISLILTYFCARHYVRLQTSLLEVQGRINGFLVQIITAVAKLRTTGAEKNAFSRWASLFAKSRKLDLQAQNLMNIVEVCNYVLPFLSFASIFAFMIAHQTQFTIGAFLAFNAAFIPFYLAVTDLSNTMMQLAPMYPLWERSKVIIEEPQEILQKKAKPGVLSGHISLDEVSFRYDKNGPLVLSNVSIQVLPKEFVAIVGPSGCGKSTIVRMLLGFEKPDSGAVYYDEKDLASIDIRQVRKQLGIVLHGEGVVSGSIYDNLVCGGSYTQQQVNHALEISGFKSDVDSFPMGIHTYLAMGGTTLSGGQKQRLLIARALLPNPKILLFDEATSALDSKNQEIVRESLDELDVTRVIIAHRISTIRNADRIYVIEKGKVVQVGTFEELEAQKGIFAEMLARQKL